MLVYYIQNMTKNILLSLCLCYNTFDSTQTMETQQKGEWIQIAQGVLSKKDEDPNIIDLFNKDMLATLETSLKSLDTQFSNYQNEETFKY